MSEWVGCNVTLDLPRQQWSLLNRFRTEQGHCGACRRKWRLTDTDLCPCGETQTMSRIVESCPLTKLNGGLSRLHSADEDAVSWLTNYGLWHAYESTRRRRIRWSEAQTNLKMSACRCICPGVARGPACRLLTVQNWGRKAGSDLSSDVMYSFVIPNSLFFETMYYHCLLFFWHFPWTLK